MGELEQHVAVRDLLIAVDRALAIFCRRDGAISADTVATQNASCRAFHFGLEAGTCRRRILYRPRSGAAAAQNRAWLICSESRSGRSQRQPLDAPPRFL